MAARRIVPDVGSFAATTAFALALLMWTYVVLGAPASIILDGTGGDHFYLLLVLSSVLNCIIWGLCLGSLIYAANKRFHGRIAQQGACT